MSIPPSKDIEIRILVLEQRMESMEIQLARLHEGRILVLEQRMESMEIQLARLREFVIRLQEMVEDSHPTLYD